MITTEHVILSTKSQRANSLFNKVIIYPVPAIKVIPGESVEQRVPMLENLLEYYRKSDGATKKKILNTIFAEKLIVVNGKVTAPIYTEPIKLMLRISKSIANSKEKKEVNIDLKLLTSYQG